MKIFGIVGWKNSGKTTLMERLVAEFTRRGVRVATIKHAHHAFDVDHPGKDSHRHRMAGAVEVIVASRLRWALMGELRGEAEPSLDELLAKLSPCDLVLVEGFKHGHHLKMEVVFQDATRPRLAAEDSTIRAVATDTALPDAGQLNVPVHDLNDVPAIADFIWATLS